MNRDVEILAPAGSMEVSLGSGGRRCGCSIPWRYKIWGESICTESFGRRIRVQAIEYVHIHGRKIYMTVNTLLKDRELNELYAYLLPYYKAGLDGVIVQDIGAVKFIGAIFP